MNTAQRILQQLNEATVKAWKLRAGVSPADESPKDKAAKFVAAGYDATVDGSGIIITVPDLKDGWGAIGAWHDACKKAGVNPRGPTGQKDFDIINRIGVNEDFAFGDSPIDRIAQHSVGTEPKKKRLTPEQKKALDAYRFAVAQEDRYLGSVFVTPMGQRDHAAKVQAAYDRAKRLGLGMEHGL